MKRIKKGMQPQALIQWRSANSEMPGVKYGTHGFPTAEVQRSLLKEQGWICAYTMIRVEEASCHIEHLKPRCVSLKEGNPAETVAYDNMVACYPREQITGKPKVAFGAIYRGSKWDEKMFVSPLKDMCEAVYKFYMTGAIEPAARTNENAKWMIENLALDSDALNELRRVAIEEMGLSLTSDAPVSAKEARRLQLEICKMDAGGRFRQFCVAIQHAAKEYIRLLEKKAKRGKYRRAAQKQRKK